MLQDVRVCELLQKVDEKVFATMKAGCCERCGERLDVANYPRKPYGLNGTLPEELRKCWSKRFSACCSREGCRKRHTSESVRFMGRRRFVALVFVLVSAMTYKLTEERIAAVQEYADVDWRTLKRWRTWWREDFVCGKFWQVMRGRFKSALGTERMPLALCERFGVDVAAWIPCTCMQTQKARDSVLKLLKFLSPLTTEGGRKMM